MTEKAEWEIVDEPQPQPRRATVGSPEALLGPWWRWKLAAAATAGILVVTIIFALAGIFALVTLTATIAIVGIRKLAQWLRREQASNAWLKPQHDSKT